MAVVTFNRTDFETLVGKKLTENDYKEVLPMMGTPLEVLTAEEVTFEVFPNRPDLLAVEGFARAVQGFLGLNSGLSEYKIQKSNYEVHVDKNVLSKRGHVAFAVIKNIQFTDAFVAEFMQLQEKLALTIGRRRKKCSIGTYDLDDLKFPISYAEKDLNYKFTPLGFNEEMTIKEALEKHPRCLEYKHLTVDWKTFPVYSDAEGRAMCLMPFTNAEFAKVKSSTKNILLEVSGVEWKAVLETLNIICSSLAARGTDLYEVKAFFPRDNGRGKAHVTPNLTPWKLKLDLNYVNKLLDLDLKPKEVKIALEQMRFGFNGKEALIPAYRTDVMHPIDLVEDIAIAHGYSKFEPHIPHIPTIGQPNPKEEYYNLLRNLFVGLGFQEIQTFVLSNPDKEFHKALLPRMPHVEIQNPITVEYTSTRTSLLPGLLETFTVNASREMPQRIFEIGDVVHLDSKAETGASNISRVAGGILHSDSNFSEMKAALEAFLGNIGKTVSYEVLKHPTFIPGRTVKLLVNNKSAGLFGEVNPEVLTHFGVEYPTTLFELDVELLR